MTGQMIHWLTANYIEILGAVTGLVYLYFSIRQMIWLWPLGLITSLLYIYIFFQAKFYADMSLQFYYVFISIYGWYHWKRNNGGKNTDLPVTSTGPREILIFIAVTLLMSIAAGYALDNYTDSPLPYPDAFTTAGSIVATWMLARKYLEQWLFWIVIDFVSMCMYFYKELYPTVILFAVYTLMSFVGYYNWKKDLKREAA